MTYKKLTPQIQSAFWKTFQEVLDRSYHSPSTMEQEIEAAITAGHRLLKKINNNEKIDHTRLVDHVWQKVVTTNRYHDQING